jgi:Tol biopolymer transport system component
VRRRRKAGLALAVLLSALTPPTAAAFYDNGFDAVPGAFLVSADYNRLEEGDDATSFAAISADGRYVVFQTRARNFFADEDADPAGRYRAGGVFRFDLGTRALQKVADGNLFEEGTNAFLRRGAANPSVSGDGRYVAFSTAQQLVPADGNENVDAYVRDMNLPLPPGGACSGGGQCAYRLVSARDGSEAPASYGPPTVSLPGSNPGAEVARGGAISADGNRVVFRTDAPTDLPAEATTDVPAGQLFVRDLATQRTTLVTASRDPETGQMTQQPAGGALGGAISADGTTVAWTGDNASAQTRFLRGEPTSASEDYYLWRRIAAGPGAPTRRITGIADPDDPTCAAMEAANPGMTTSFNQTSTGPCYGPLTDQESLPASIASQLPVLSGDGNTVAFLTGSGPRPDVTTGSGLDLYLTSMKPGLSRKAATTELTRDGTSTSPALAASIEGLAMTADGRHLALATVRTTFTLPVLQLVGEPRSIADVRDLYAIDLEEHTVERVTHSVEDGDANGDVDPHMTLSSDAGLIAFSSFAANMFVGDANDRPDAFVVTRESEPPAQGPPPSARRGGAASIEEFGRRRLSVRARSAANGTVVLTVSVPGAGRLTATVRKKGRKLAQDGSRPRRKGKARLVLRLHGKARAQVAGGTELHARAKVGFAGGGKRLHGSVAVIFARH